MKTKTIYYFGSVLLFVILFYDKFAGINLSILTLVLLGASYHYQSNKSLTPNYWVALMGGGIGALSFAYFKDFFSFMVIFISLNWVAMLMFSPQQNLIKLFLLTPLNYMMSLFNVASTNIGFSTHKNHSLFQKVIAYGVVPLVITFVFGWVYVASSDWVSDYISTLSFNVNIEIGSLLWNLLLGTVYMYFFWYFKLPLGWMVVQVKLPDEYKAKEFVSTDRLSLVRKSAEITFVMLNIILLLFVIIYGFENLYDVENINSVSANLHKRVYAVILSIIMAICLILFFFRDKFNFDEKNKNLKRLTFAWIVLNFVLVFIAFAKNVEYVYMLGLTEKRIGVFVFLILCWLGLFLTYKKVHERKTNWFLIHRMTMAVYVTFIFMAIFNWGWVITKFNIATHIPIEQDLNYYKYHLKGNQVLLYEYFESKGNQEQMNEIKNKVLEKDYQLSLEGYLLPVYEKYKLSN